MFFYEVLIGLLANAYIVHLPWTGWIFLILIGFTFEIITASSWTYSEDFKRSFFTINNSDISIAAAFSWAGVLVTCIALGYAAADIISFEHAAGVWIIIMVGVIGNILETICVRWRMFVYNSTWVTRMLVFKKPFFIAGVPLPVRLGYFVIFGPVCWACVRYCT